MKTLLYLFLFILLIGCKSNKEKELKSEIRQIYLDEINDVLTSFDKRYMLNEAKTHYLRKKAIIINEDFLKIDSAITFNKSDLKLTPLINEIINVYGYDKLQEDLTLKMRFDLLKSAVADNTIKTKENTILLLDLYDKVMTKLYNEIDKNNYKFNFLQAYVLSDKPIINVGETYEGRVFLAAFDTTKYPSVTFMNERVPVVNGIGIIKIKASSKGIKHSKGEVEWCTEDNGQLIKLPFEFTYQVK